MPPQPLKVARCGGKRLPLEAEGPASSPSLSHSHCVALDKFLCSSELLVLHAMEQRCCKVIVRIKRARGGLARRLDARLRQRLLPVT